MSRHRHRRRRRIIRYARALAPFLLLLLAGLLSAGLVRVVETGPRHAVVPEESEPVEVEPAPIEHLDLELFDEEEFWEQRRLRDELERQQQGILLDWDTWDEGQMEPAMGQSLTEEMPAGGDDEPVEATGDAPFDWLDLGRAEPPATGRLFMMPEPGTGVLVTTGLLALRLRAPVRALGLRAPAGRGTPSPPTA